MSVPSSCQLHQHQRIAVLWETLRFPEIFLTISGMDVFRFGPFELNVREHRLVRDGSVIPLRGKVFDTLRLLVENAGSLVSKEDLLRGLWPDAAVEENN